MWCVGRSGSFAEAVLTAANLGNDADTTAAITGQLAGAIYGFSGIPKEWRQRVFWSSRIVEVGDRLLQRGASPAAENPRR
jgi:ADP-ribosyl-[dinitrogen reductase] hydrolase